MALVFLEYAAAKATFAAQGKLGVPGGPKVPASEYTRYSGQLIGVAATQWLAVAAGLLGVALCLSTVTPIGRRVPRALMLLALAGALLGVGAGATITIVDVVVGIGVGWRWYHAVMGVVAFLVLTAMTLSYVRATKHVTR